jgi:hypothetical protein
LVQVAAVDDTSDEVAVSGAAEVADLVGGEGRVEDAVVADPVAH